jgi:hypothetical protein
MEMLPTYGEQPYGSMAEGRLKTYVKKLGLTDFGRGKLGLKNFTIGGWVASIGVAKED